MPDQASGTVVGVKRNGRPRPFGFISPDDVTLRERNANRDLIFSLCDVKESPEGGMIKGDRVTFHVESRGEGSLQVTDIRCQSKSRAWETGVVVKVFGDKGFGIISSGHQHSCYFKLDTYDESQGEPVRDGRHVRYVAVAGRDSGPTAGVVTPIADLIGKVISFGNGRGQIVPEGGGENDALDVDWQDIVISKKDGFRSLKGGDSVCFLRPDDTSRRAACVWKEHPLRRFAVLGNEDELFQHLAEDLVLEGEDWDYTQQNTSDRYPILRNYLFSTFRKLEEEDAREDEESRRKVRIVRPAHGPAVAVFNTGLVSRMYKPLYAVFEEETPHAVGTPRWRIVGFCATGERLKKTMYLTLFRGELPSRAEFFDTPADLVYDWNLRLDAVTDHILGDREHRLPRNIVERIPSDMTDQNQQIAFLDNHLQMAIQRTLERIRWNFKTAVPQYSFQHGRIQLLLPLCITDPRKVDIALAVQREGEAYVGYTILPLDWAYSNARLIARPYSDWLSPEQIRERSEEAEEKDGEDGI